MVVKQSSLLQSLFMYEHENIPYIWVNMYEKN